MASHGSISRVLVGTLATALLGLVPLGVTAPAQAATTSTRIVAQPVRTSVPYHDDFTIRGRVEYRDGDAWLQLPPGNGATVLERRMRGSDVWRVLETDPSGETFAFHPTAVGNAVYRVVFQGDDTYAMSSATRGVDVTRLMHDRVVEGTLVLRGRVEPGWANRNVVVQVRRSGEWRRYALVRTDDDSRWSKRLFAVQGRRTYFRAFVPETTRFAKSFTETYFTFVAASDG